MLWRILRQPLQSDWVAALFRPFDRPQSRNPLFVCGCGQSDFQRGFDFSGFFRLLLRRRFQFVRQRETTVNYFVHQPVQEAESKPFHIVGVTLDSFIEYPFDLCMISRIGDQQKIEQDFLDSGVLNGLSIFNQLCQASAH